MKNNTAKKNIPQGWKEIYLGDSEYLNILPSGINEFDGIKKYLSTSSVVGNIIVSVESEIDFNERPSRANMQPILNSVWFAKMKDTLKVLEINDKKMADNYILSTGFAGIQCGKNIKSNFLKQIILSDKFNNKKNAKAKGSTQKAINTEELKTIKILIPPTNEQQKIAEILGAVDEDILKTQELIDDAEKLKKGLMQKLFTHGVGHTKFKKTKLGEIPEEWDVVSIKKSSIDLIDGDRGVNYPKQKDFLSEGYCLFLSAKNVSKNGFEFDELSFISKEKDEILRKGKLQRDDIVLTSRGTVGNIAYYDKNIPFENARINSGMLIFRHGDQFDPLFLYKYLSGPQMKKKYLSMGSGSAQPQLPVGSLELIELPLVPISEQRKIAEIILAIDEKISINKELKSKLIQLKKGLAQDLLSGKIRVAYGSNR